VIASVNGTVIAISGEAAVIEVGGVGLAVQCTPATLRSPGPQCLNVMSDTFSTRYAALIAAGKIEADPGQAMLAAQLAALARRLDQRRLARKSSSLGWLFAKNQQAGPPASART